MEITQLRQLVAIADAGVLSRAASVLNISQPALSRSVQRLESELGVQLFDRTKNSIALNSAGNIAVAQARVILAGIAALEEKLFPFRSAVTSLSIATCAPAPLWKITAGLAVAFPGVHVSSEMPDEDEIVAALLSERAQLGIVRKDVASAAIEAVPLLGEQLFVQVPDSNPLSRKDGLCFADLAGQEIRVYTETGFWNKVHHECIPGARFIEYRDFMVYMNIVKSAGSIVFTTSLGHTLHEERAGCTSFELRDGEAYAQYRLAFLKKNRAQLKDIVQWIADAAQTW